MNSQTVILGALWGAILGLFYFGGLWLTVHRVPRAARPKSLLALSFAARLATLMACFWFALQRDSVLFGVTLLSFFLMRFIMTGLLGKPVRGDVHAN